MLESAVSAAGKLPVFDAATGPRWPAPALVANDQTGGRRTRTWEISPTLHCSIVGTCLTTGELRRLFAKLGHRDARTASDHDLHGRGVVVAGRRDVASKLLNKALDKRHERTIKRFAKAGSPEEVKALWLQALDEGDIAGGYWAVLSHPASDSALVEAVFGEVHMLSHLVGSSNRLDLARLRKLEQALEEKEETITGQQARLQAAIRERTALLDRVAVLEEERTRRGAIESLPAQPVADETGPLRRKLEAEKARSADLAERLSEAQDALTVSRRTVDELQAREQALLGELAAFEREIAPDEDGHGEAERPSLGGRTLLYVGGRPGQIAGLRAAIKRRGGTLITHDGGIEDNPARLPGLVSQATAALSPVDCVSHHAVWQVKKLCRETGKTFVPLRTASLASFLAALDGSDILGRKEALAG
ncbi:MAG: hypothetical protein CMM50_00740 [Rhodospirillaceae bacterium]|nr:hypothetical protein [Rhodospirillaceae bacterium]